MQSVIGNIDGKQKSIYVSIDTARRLRKISIAKKISIEVIEQEALDYALPKYLYPSEELIIEYIEEFEVSEEIHA